MFKTYVDKRKRILCREKYKKDAEIINVSVGKLLKPLTNNHTVDFFLEECRRKKDELLAKIENGQVIVSEELHVKIKDVNIMTLHECLDFGSALIEVYKEQEPGSSTPVIYLGNTPILLLNSV